MAASTLPPLPFSTQVFTFYSFKGGVGRSMALVNTAAQLSRAGRRVLIIDLDLEAPGVSYLANKQGHFPKRGGFVDILYDFLNEGEKSPLGSPELINPFADYTMSLNLDDTAQEAGGGTVTALPAGKLSNLLEYQRRVGFLEPARLYQEGIGNALFAHFKTRLCGLLGDDHFDYVLVDSRTGFTAESTIAVRDLADHLVVVMGLNHQNVEGTCGFLKVLRSEAQRPQSVTIVFSPIPLGEDDLAEKRIKVARKKLHEAWPEMGSEEAIGRLVIPYHPRLALDESPHQARLTNQVLTGAYRAIYERVRKLVNDSVQDYIRVAKTLIERSLAKEALPYLARLLAGEHPNAVNLAQKGLSMATDARTQSIYIELLRPSASSSLEVTENLARLFVSKRLIDDAVAILTAFLARHPEDAMAWLSKGRILEEVARNEEATICFRKVVELLPEQSFAWNRYACHLWEKRKFDEEAANAFGMWTTLKSEDPIGIANYSEFCLAFEQYDKAKAAMLQAWSLRPAGSWDGQVLFCAALYWRMVNDLFSEALQLRRIKQGLNNGLRLSGGTFTRLLEQSSSKLDKRVADFYNLLSLVVIGQERSEKLSEFEKWAELRGRSSLAGELFVTRGGRTKR